MRVTTGYTATVSKDLILDYQCSKCGAKNHSKQTVSGTGTTSLFFGSIVNENYRQDAQDQLIYKLKLLCSEKPSERYEEAKFSCKCSKCGHREPWARLRYGYLKTVWKFIGWTVMFAFAFLAGGVSAVPILIYLAAMLWAAVHKPIHRRQMFKKIDALPPESLPRIMVPFDGQMLELKPDGPASNTPKPEEPKREEPPKPVVPVVPKEEPKPLTVRLQLMTGPMAGQIFRCREGEPVVIGRNPSRCNFLLNGYPSVSGNHCRMEIIGGCLTVTDLGSTNGTFVNGTRLTPNQPASAADGAELKLATQGCTISIKYE